MCLYWCYLCCICVDVGVACFVNVSCCRFDDVCFKGFCMGGVPGRGLGALAMSTRVGELCVVEYFCC